MSEKKDEKKEEKRKERTPMAALQSLPGAPTPKEVEDWKTEHGEVFIFMPSKTECYVWRAILRSEWTNLQMFAAENGLSELQAEESMLKVCVLWPKAVDWQSKKAGTASTLAEQIMYNSHFLPAASAASFVAQL